MKILHLVDVPWDSGLAHYALVLAQAQKKNGHKVFVSALPGEKPWHKAHKLGLKTLPLVKFRNLSALRRIVREHQIDILNAHTGSSHSLAVAATLGQKAAVVRTRSDARIVKARPGSRLLFAKTPRIISAADYIRDSFVRDLKMDPQKVVTIYQGIEVERSSPAPFPKAPVLGIVARLDPVKGHRYLLEALALLVSTYPSLTLKVAGQEENIKVRELQNIAQRLRIEERIQFLGFQKDIPGFLSGCSIGVVASTGSEAVSRAALEWMSAGRPVVATRVGCLPELVVDSVTGYLAEPKEASSLASSIARLLHDPEKAKSMGAQGLSRVMSDFAMDRFVEKTFRVYQEALQSV